MDSLKNDFPIFSAVGDDAVYLDSAASAHKPRVVIEAISDFYSNRYSSVHRGVYRGAESATAAFEAVRAQVAGFINAAPEEIIFTKGATEGINLVASSWALNNCGQGDIILISALEHHANFLPWQEVCKRTGAELAVVPIDGAGQLEYQFLEDVLAEGRVKLVCVAHVSHVFGSTIDVLRIGRAARGAGALFLVDACQSAPHGLVDVAEIQPDFLVFSAHKMGGPTGVGVLYIRSEIAQNMPPYQFGGGMVFSADSGGSSWRIPPHRFEAGTPPIAQVIGLGAAILYLETIDMSAMLAHETMLIKYVYTQLAKLPGITVLGPELTCSDSQTVVSFVHERMHPHDIAAFLDARGIAVRAGDHCAQPLMKSLGVGGTVRISVYCYTSLSDVKRLVCALQELCKSL